MSTDNGKIDLMNLAAYLQQIRQNSDIVFSENLCAFQLGSGLSNHNYLLQDGVNKWVLRVNQNASDGFVRRKDELASWQIAGNAGLAPQLRFVSSTMDCFLSDYVETQSDWSQLAHDVDGAAVDNQSICLRQRAPQLLAQLLLAMQDLPLPQNHISLSRQWQHYLTQLHHIAVKLETMASSGPPNTNQLAISIEQWQTQWQRLQRLHHDTQLKIDSCDAVSLRNQYSHRDLTPYNLLLSDEHLLCIDFEYACQSHPLFDLAVVLQTHGISSSQQAQLKALYFSKQQNLKLGAEQALPAMGALYWTYSAAWALLMAGQSLLNGDESKLLPHLAKDYLSWFENYYTQAAK
ncbi:phosphotransferase [Shewanella waksmanii]|uniref:phosphotransferase n=1 Tax=Shewanella waksmanii TaxID=213783 RepID=UPI0037364A85